MTDTHELPTPEVVKVSRNTKLLTVGIPLVFTMLIVGIVLFMMKPAHHVEAQLQVHVRFPSGKLERGSGVYADVGQIGVVTRIKEASPGIMVSCDLWENAPRAVRVKDARAFVRDTALEVQPPYGVHAFNISHLMTDPDLYLLGGKSDELVSELVAWDHQPFRIENGYDVTIELRDGSRLIPPFPIIGESGVVIGEVQDASDQGDTVSFHALIYFSTSDEYRRSGTLYYVPEPEVSWDGGASLSLKSLEAVLGRSYLRASRSQGGELTQHFRGFNEIPLRVRANDPVMFICYAAKAGSIMKGSQVLFRESPIGMVEEDPHPTPDGTRVSFPIWIEREYSGLVCENTVFADCGGIGLQLPHALQAMQGDMRVTTKAHNVRSTVNGALAVFIRPPPACGRVLGEGASIWMEPEVPEEFRVEFQSNVSLNGELQRRIGHHELIVLRIVREYVEDVTGNRFGFGKHADVGYGLVVDGGLLAPENLIGIPQVTLYQDQLHFKVAEQEIARPRETLWKGSGLRLVPAPGGQQGWPATEISSPATPTTLFVATDLQQPFVTIPADELQVRNASAWEVQSLRLPAGLHGAPVFDGDAKLVGLLRYDGSRWTVALLGRTFRKEGSR